MIGTEQEAPCGTHQAWVPSINGPTCPKGPWDSAGRGGAGRNHKGGTGLAPLWSSARVAWLLVPAPGPSMGDHGGVGAQGHDCKPAHSLDVLMKVPLQLPRIRTRPWWFPVQELRDPLAFYLEAWLADSIFGERPGVHGWPRPLQSERSWQRTSSQPLSQIRRPRLKP